MRSPVSPDVDLQPREIEPGLAVLECPRSGGIWIPLAAYEQWRSQSPPVTASAAASGSTGPGPMPVDAQRPALICPESGCVLLRYKAGHGLPFHIDRSPVTGGVWLDKGEWEALKEKGLHVDLNLIFTAAYQRGLRSAEYAQTLEKAFQDRIGQVDFDRVAQFKDWLNHHPRRRDIWCYLSDTLKG
jgi:Zn-finger nucleic acid-binding protein